MKINELSLAEIKKMDAEIPEMEIFKDGEIEKLKGGFAVVAVCDRKANNRKANISNHKYYSNSYSTNPNQ
ncbi:MAG: hypothetical protein ACK5MI_00740 [Mangrovibacterium sp.]